MNSQGASNPKLAERQSYAVANAKMHSGNHRMPFAWAARPVYKMDGSLDVRSDFSPLFKLELDKLREEDIFRAVHEYQRSTLKPNTQHKLRFVVIPGMFVAMVDHHTADYPTVTSSLLHVAPYPDEELAPRREVMPFHATPVLHPHLTYYDFLYIYPRSVNFVSKKIGARNIVCRILLLETDVAKDKDVSVSSLQRGGSVPIPETGLKNIFGRSTTTRFVTSAVTTVSYHMKQPSFFDEIKIAVPSAITPHHHLLFIFSHVSVKDKKKRTKSSGTVGCAILPLEEALASKTSTFRLCVSSTSSDNSTLPSNYLELMKYRTVERDNLDREVEQIPPVGIRSLDDGKPLFVVDTRAHSTIRHHDDHLKRFFDACSKHDWTSKSNNELANAIKALRVMNDSALYGFLPMIFSQLLQLLPMSTSSPNEITKNVLTYILFAIGRIHSNSEQNAIVRGFIDHIFKTTFDPQSLRSVHDGIISELPAILHDPEQKQAVIMYAWFFLRIITKSMTQMLKFARLESKPRPERFPKVNISV